MRLAIISHKLCTRSEASPTGFATDGGFPLQVKAISELFSETTVVVPCEEGKEPGGLTPLSGRNMKVEPLSVPSGRGLVRKLLLPLWLIENGRTILKAVWKSDAVHAPIPGDVGTAGMLFALALRKPLFVRHCGNWLVQRTTAEHIWIWLMEKTAGGRNVMFATGGGKRAPSEKNPAISWIFSSSLTADQLESARPRPFPSDGRAKIITACRLEPKKGVDVVIRSLSKIRDRFPGCSLDIVGGGSLERELKQMAKDLGIEDAVHFHGKIPQSDVLRLLRESHVFCFPTTASEGFPKAVLEALGCGLPVVTTPVSVLPELVRDDCGIVMDAATEDLTASAVCSLLSNADQYEKMSENAIGRAEDYSLERWKAAIAERLENAWGAGSLSA